MTIVPPQRFRVLGSLLAAAAVSAACKRPAPFTVPGSEVSTDTGAAAPSKPGAQAAVPDFANRAWKVAKGSEGDPGTFYVFLADGSLLITSPHGTPSLGTWHYSGEVLTMVEQGLPHQATVLRLTPDTFSISIAGSGQPVVLTFIPGTAK